MADTFTPRGAPVPSNSYDGWELTHRPAMLPFLAEYTNPQGETAGGWAMPNMVTEPVNALFRLMNTPAGTMPDPRDSQNQSDALTGLMALYGGNALGGVARNAMSRGIAMGRPNMEAARPVAYSNAIDEAMSNPNMLSMMRDIDYANLNRRALDDYGVGYEGLSSSQEAKLRGWSDPALLSDTGKPNPVGAGVSSHLDMSPEARLARAREQGFDTNTTWYHGSFNDFDAFDPRTIGDNFAADDKGFFFSNVPSQASDYALSDTVGLPKDGGMVYPTHIKFERPLIVDESRLRREGMGGVLGKTEDPISFWDNYQGLLHEWAAKEGADGITIVDNSYKVPHGPNKGQSSMMHVAFNPEDIRSVNAAFDPAKAGQNGLLLSDTGKPNPLGAALASQDPDNTNALAELLKRYGVY